MFPGLVEEEHFVAAARRQKRLATAERQRSINTQAGAPDSQPLSATLLRLAWSGLGSARGVFGRFGGTRSAHSSDGAAAIGSV